ncbi:MAG: hypothetical protein HY606_04515, partial [Planctomycetes bacterium]|nr:hypothetical protein [Planctomycetota bacterium]
MKPVLAVLIGFFNLCADEVKWITDIDSGLKQSKDKGKPAFLWIYSPEKESSPIGYMKEFNKLFANEELIKRLNNELIPIRLEMDFLNMEMSKRMEKDYDFKLQSPQLIFLHPSGKELKQYRFSMQAYSSKVIELD